MDCPASASSRAPRSRSPQEDKVIRKSTSAVTDKPVNWIHLEQDLAALTLCQIWLLRLVLRAYYELSMLSFRFTIWATSAKLSSAPITGPNLRILSHRPPGRSDPHDVRQHERVGAVSCNKLCRNITGREIRLAGLRLRIFRTCRCTRQTISSASSSALELSYATFWTSRGAKYRCYFWSSDPSHARGFSDRLSCGRARD